MITVERVNNEIDEVLFEWRHDLSGHIEEARDEILGAFLSLVNEYSDKEILDYIKSW